MADEKRPEPTERTSTGYEVPVPKRREFFGNLKKVAKPQATPKPQQSGNRRPPPSHTTNSK